jgi:hypothetical protein
LYIPHVAITVTTSRTRARASAHSPVIGLTPPLARVAPIVARSLPVTRTEQIDR